MNGAERRCSSGIGRTQRNISREKRNREFLSPVSTRFLEKEVVKTARLSGYPE
jgi:hypothetical protein